MSAAKDQALAAAQRVSAKDVMKGARDAAHKVPPRSDGDHSCHGRCLTVHRSLFFILRQYLDGGFKQCFTVCTHRMDTVQDP